MFGKLLKLLEYSGIHTEKYNITSELKISMYPLQGPTQKESAKKIRYFLYCMM